MEYTQVHRKLKVIFIKILKPSKKY